MPAAPPESVFPALVVAAHVVTLIFAWRRRVGRRRKGAAAPHGEVNAFRRSSRSDKRPLPAVPLSDTPTPETRPAAHYRLSDLQVSGRLTVFSYL
ncbi:hypothetical protein EYF80_054047 [Liparis tanakae]|uniref:Uncharacterized protein n=1 Tax=Liparis tanakae TaxID=230148 RepID=A0A4Z2F4I1_9TELE|nr:hypothetical protein EYF80_054047 [Liparis tanakae]